MLQNRCGLSPAPSPKFVFQPSPSLSLFPSPISVFQSSPSLSLSFSCCLSTPSPNSLFHSPLSALSLSLIAFSLNSLSQWDLSICIGVHSLLHTLLRFLSPLSLSLSFSLLSLSHCSLSNRPSLCFCSQLQFCLPILSLSRSLSHARSLSLFSIPPIHLSSCSLVFLPLCSLPCPCFISIMCLFSVPSLLVLLLCSASLS